MTTAPTDRAGRIRVALLELVAARGFRGTAMADVADRAGVAAGTIYRHYASKNELVAAVHREVKDAMGAAALAGVDPSALPERRFRQMWLQVQAHLRAAPERARFLLQAEASPLIGVDALADDPAHPLAQAAAADDVAPLLLDVPVEVVYLLGFGPAVTLAARGDRLDAEQLDNVAAACWRAITR